MNILTESSAFKNLGLCLDKVLKNKDADPTNGFPHEKLFPENCIVTGGIPLYRYVHKIVV